MHARIVILSQYECQHTVSAGMTSPNYLLSSNWSIRIESSGLSINPVPSFEMGYRNKLYTVCLVCTCNLRFCRWGHFCTNLISLMCKKSTMLQFSLLGEMVWYLPPCICIYFHTKSHWLNSVQDCFSSIILNKLVGFCQMLLGRQIKAVIT